MATRPVLLVGSGFRGGAWARAVRDHRAFRLAGVVDPSDEARAHAEASGVAAFETFEAGVGSLQPAAVVIASPNPTHSPLALRCIDAGIGFIVEKPLAATVAEALPVARAAEAGGIPALVAQTKRFVRREEVIRRLIRSGAVGRVDRVTMTYVYTRHAPSVGDLVDTEIVHMLDTLRLRFGIPERIVTGGIAGEGSTGTRGLIVAADWPGDRNASIVLRLGSEREAFAEHIDGEDGQILVLRERVYLQRGSRRPRRIWFPHDRRPDRILLDRLHAWLEGTPSPDLSPTENLSTIALIEATRASIDGGHEVDPAAYLASERR